MLQGNHKGEVVNLLKAFGFDEKIIVYQVINDLSHWM